MSRKKAASVSPGQLSLFDIQLEQFTTDAFGSQASLLLPEPKPHALKALQTTPPQLEELTANLPETQSPPLEEQLAAINLDKLTRRSVRKIASSLGIAQKVGGKDQSLSWLKAQIKKRLIDQPHETAPIITKALRAS